MRIIERFVKNYTPYVGKLVLKFEKNSDYNSISQGYLNKIHLSFFSWKLSSRLIPNIVEKSLELKTDIIVFIEKYTNCVLHRYIKKTDEVDGGYIFSYNLLYDKQHYWGDLDFGWWMVKNQIIVSNELPQNVAFRYKDRKIIGSLIKVRDKKIFLDIGDRIFDEKYQPSSVDFEKKEWEVWAKKYKEDFISANNEDKIKIRKEGIKRYLPIQKMGRFEIKTKEDLLLSSKNIAKFISK